MKILDQIVKPKIMSGGDIVIFHINSMISKKTIAKDSKTGLWSPKGHVGILGLFI
jgi:hypothetical protein